ncbi:hypothetical protein [Dactylosporangium darangshiense]|uniref:hypothetical protein n=1 Tax=Dactylosporangium darangshiense TaxID=579108 RepID=UPI00362EA1FE
MRSDSTSTVADARRAGAAPDRRRGHGPFRPAVAVEQVVLRPSLFELKQPAKAQLVACADLVEAGQDVLACKFDDPKPDSLPLKEGVYQPTRRTRLRRAEVAELVE